MMQKPRKGFTLFELLIVIFLLLLLYMLVFGYFQKTEKKPKPLTPLTLKSTLQESGKLIDHTTLLCIDKCKSCYLRQGSQNSFELYEEPIQLEGMEVYTIDSEDALVQVEYGRYQDKKVCLKLDFYPNGSSTKAILKTKEGVYYLPSYFGEPKTFESIEKAKDFWLKEAQLASGEGDFY